MRTLGGSSQSRIDRFCLSFSNLSSSSVTSSSGSTSNIWTSRSISHSSNSNSKDRNKVAYLFVFSMLIRRVRRANSSSDNTITSGTTLTGSTKSRNTISSPTTNISSSTFNSCVNLTCIVCVSHLQVLLYTSPTAQTADGVAAKSNPRALRC